jgi:hypothetical protein
MSLKIKIEHRNLFQQQEYGIALTIYDNENLYCHLVSSIRKIDYLSTSNSKIDYLSTSNLLNEILKTIEFMFNSNNLNVDKKNPRSEDIVGMNTAPDHIAKVILEKLLEEK